MRTCCATFSEVPTSWRRPAPSACKSSRCFGQSTSSQVKSSSEMTPSTTSPLGRPTGARYREGAPRRNLLGLVAPSSGIIQGALSLYQAPTAQGAICRAPAGCSWVLAGLSCAQGRVAAAAATRLLLSMIFPRNRQATAGPRRKPISRSQATGPMKPGGLKKTSAHAHGRRRDGAASARADHHDHV